MEFQLHPDLQNQTALFNGNYIPLKDVAISPFDRGFLFGDAIYEVIPVYQGKMLGRHEHIDRLLVSLEKVGIASPYSHDEWIKQLTALLSNDLPAEMLYLQVTRGAEPVRKHRLPVSVPPTVFAFAMPITPPITANYAGCHGHLLPDLRWQRCDVKSTSLMANIMSYHTLHERGVANDEALLVRDGFVVEAPSSNVFMVKDGVVLTPPLDNILTGVVRGMVIADAKKLGIPTLETPITTDMLLSADEVWVTNSYEELKPIIKIDDKPIGNGNTGKTWLALYEAYQARKG